ncbi:hypothetical protein CBR_g63104 [Chara braunii]|uniref:Uncharacterized protein n=1 Tax=Chara braunii TaxID=69332 RepID=A0A388K8Y1_CHABU|nr:hypothetical protein CBR_g63104 [Chara braunii]|eukprot:GBG66522.1 hypothetical protein CBR_g63104 [Chara braunii]
MMVKPGRSYNLDERGGGQLTSLDKADGHGWNRRRDDGEAWPIIQSRSSRTGECGGGGPFVKVDEMTQCAFARSCALEQRRVMVMDGWMIGCKVSDEEVGSFISIPSKLKAKNTGGVSGHSRTGLVMVGGGNLVPILPEECLVILVPEECLVILVRGSA